MTESATRETARVGVGIVGHEGPMLTGFPLPRTNSGLLEMLTPAIVDGAIDLAVKEA